MAAVALMAACGNAEKPATDDVKDAVTDVADDAATKVSPEHLVEFTVAVHGMTCEGCENAVKKSVGSLEGIAEVTASHMDSVAVVSFDSTLTTLAAIEGKITEAGYTVIN